MSLSDALNYPFKHRNLARIVPIAIMYSIVIFLVQYFAFAENTFLLFLSMLAMLFFSVALSGFFIRVLRTVRHDNDVLPEFNQMRDDFKPGCVNVLGVVFHGMIMALFLVVVSILSLDFLLLLIFPLMLVIWGVYTIALIRYAFEFRTGAMFELSRNFSLAREYVGGLGGLFWRFLVIGILSFGVSALVNGVLQSLFIGDMPQTQMPDMGTWLMLALVNIIAYTISVVFTLSQYHLMARFGQQLDTGDRKSKDKNDYAVEGGRQY
jgi:hypothetical protein